MDFETILHLLGIHLVVGGPGNSAIKHAVMLTSYGAEPDKHKTFCGRKVDRYNPQNNWSSSLPFSCKECERYLVQWRESYDRRFQAYLTVQLRKQQEEKVQ